MLEKKPDEPMIFSRFSDWCRYIDSLSEGAKHTLEVLLKTAGTDDAEAAEQILLSMTELDLRENKITDIGCLSSFTNLTELHLFNNEITETSSLGSLTNLTTLYLDNNHITDISALRELINLTTLHLHYNQITDIRSFGSLTNLKELYLDSNGITDISALRSLTNLTTLHLHYNRITDISSLASLTNLTTLSLYWNNEITDISALRELTNLTILNLCWNDRITDISALGSLTNLTELYMGDVRVTDISFLASLTNLTILHLFTNRITEISSLASLTNLTTLDLSSNEITDISSLGSLANLTTLYLGMNQITDISALRELTNLTELYMGGDRVTDISALGSLTNLTKLHLFSDRITDISFLTSLTNLTTLYLGNNRITDISLLASLTNLTELNLNNNGITDISALREFTNLKELHLTNNQITDISALRELTNLTKLHFDRNIQITDISVLGELAQKHLALSTKPIDAEKATAAVKVAYAAIGLEAPKIIICSSPRDAFLQIFNFLKSDRSENSSNQWSWNRSGKKLNWESMSSRIVKQVASPGMWNYELDLITIESEANGILMRLMREFADEYARSEPTMGDFCPDRVLELISPGSPTVLLKEIYLTEVYISALGINLSEETQEILRCQKLLLEHCGWIFSFGKICVVCDRPRHLRFDSQNWLHAEGECAIEFADGWNFYYHHGVKLPERYGKIHPNLWKAEWLLAEENVELKRVSIQGIGYDRLIQELAAEQIDSWQEYALLRIDNADVEPIYLLKMSCPSTGFIHALRVPPNLTSAREAVSWVNWDIEPEEFSVQT